VRAYCPYSPKSSIPQFERGGASAALKVARAAHSAPGPRSSLAVTAVLCLRPGGACTRPEAHQSSSAGGKARDRSKIGRQRLSKRMGVGRPIKLPAVPGVPTFCDSLLSGSTAKRLGARSSAPRHSGQGPEPPVDPQRPGGRQSSPAGRQVPAAGANYSVGLWAPERFELGHAAIATNVHQLWPGLSMPIRYGV